MGTEVLRPKDCLKDNARFARCVDAAHVQHREPYPRFFIRDSSRSCRSDRRKAKSSSGGAGRCRAFIQHELVMENVRILRRGETLNLQPTSRSERNDRRISMEEPTTPTQAGRHHKYAGSAFHISPEPKSLPLPSFSTSKQEQLEDFCASRELMHLLQLNC